MGSQPQDPELLEIPGTEGAGEDATNLAIQQLLNLMGQTIDPQQIPELQVGPAQQIPGLQVGPAQNIPGLQVGPAQQVPGLQAGPAQQIPGLQVGPAQQIAGMTGIEQSVQSMLAQYLGTSATEGQAYKLGMGEISKTLGGEAYDPRTSDFWKGYREYSAMEQEKGVSDIRRRGQLGGGLFGTPNQRAEAEYIRGMGAERTMQLGGLYEKERDRRTGAVAQALGYAGFGEQGTLSRLQAGTTIGALPRLIKGQEYQADYTQQEKKDQAAYAQQSGQSQADFNQQQLQSQAAFAQQLGQSQADIVQQQAANQAAFAQQFGQSESEFAQQQLQSQATYTQALGQSEADIAQQQALNQAQFAQLSGQSQADYAAQLTEIGLQTGAAQQLMPQWYIDQTQPADPLGGILGIVSSIISK